MNILKIIYLNTAAQIYELSCTRLYLHHSTAKLIYDSQQDQHPVGLMAQLLEHRTGIAKVIGSNPVRA